MSYGSYIQFVKLLTSYILCRTLERSCLLDFYGACVLFTHTLGESAFWVFVYEALLHLKHSRHPRILSEQMQILFSNNIPPRDGVVVDGRQKVNVITLFSVDRSKDLSQFQKHSVNDLLNALEEFSMIVAVRTANHL